MCQHVFYFLRITVFLKMEQKKVSSPTRLKGRAKKTRTHIAYLPDVWNALLEEDSSSNATRERLPQ